MRNALSVFFVGSALLMWMLFTAPVVADKPPKEPPLDMVEMYTLNGRIPMERFYVDDTNQGGATHFAFNNKSISNYIVGSRKILGRIQGMVDSGKLNSKTMQFLKKEDWFYFSLQQYKSNILNSNIAVVGAMEPWLEASCLELGAAHVTTIEYNNLTYDHPNLTTISKINFPLLYQEASAYLDAFDVVLSQSSFDHDGLGRYGDPLDPEGDFKAMQNVQKLLKPGGLLIISVPVGPDVIVFNLHRRYGAIRLPLLLQGWEVVDQLFFDPKRLEAKVDYRKSYEPVFVLKKPLAPTNVRTGAEVTGSYVADIVDDTVVHSPKEL